MAETAKERRDRELGELLNELRVALPGIQVLFAFMLTVPSEKKLIGDLSPIWTNLGLNDPSCAPVPQLMSASCRSTSLR